METVIPFAAMGISLVLGILGMLVSVHSPQSTAEKRALVASFGLLALIAAGTAYAHQRLEAREQPGQGDNLEALKLAEARFDKEVAALKSAAAESQEEIKGLKSSVDLSTAENEKLVEQNAELVRKINALENKVTANEAAQALKRDIIAHMSQVRAFLNERLTQTKTMMMDPGNQRRFQMQTAALYFRQFFPATVNLLQRAAEMGLIERSSFAKDDEFIKSSIAAGRVASTHLRQLDSIVAQIP